MPSKTLYLSQIERSVEKFFAEFIAIFTKNTLLLAFQIIHSILRLCQKIPSYRISKL